MHLDQKDIYDDIIITKQTIISKSLAEVYYLYWKWWR